MPVTNLMLNGVHVDSDEEYYVAAWLQELTEAGIIHGWHKVQKAIPLTSGLYAPYVKRTVLKTKVKEELKNHKVLSPSEYTPDFVFTSPHKHFPTWLATALHPLGDFDPKSLFWYPEGLHQIYLEVKPVFDQNNMEREFKLKQKFLWEKYQTFVNLVEPVELFKNSFLPLSVSEYFKYKKSPTGKNKGIKKPGDWKMDWTPKTLKELINAKSETNSSK